MPQNKNSSLERNQEKTTTENKAVLNKQAIIIVNKLEFGTLQI